MSSKSSTTIIIHSRHVCLVVSVSCTHVLSECTYYAVRVDWCQNKVLLVCQQANWSIQDHAEMSDISVTVYWLSCSLRVTGSDWEMGEIDRHSLKTVIRLSLSVHGALPPHYSFILLAPPQVHHRERVEDDEQRWSLLRLESGVCGR